MAIGPGPRKPRPQLQQTSDKFSELAKSIHELAEFGSSLSPDDPDHAELQDMLRQGREELAAAGTAANEEEGIEGGTPDRTISKPEAYLGRFGQGVAFEGSKIPLISDQASGMEDMIGTSEMPNRSLRGEIIPTPTKSRPAARFAQQGFQRAAEQDVPGSKHAGTLGKVVGGTSMALDALSLGKKGMEMTGKAFPRVGKMVEDAIPLSWNPKYKAAVKAKAIHEASPERLAEQLAGERADREFKSARAARTARQDAEHAANAPSRQALIDARLNTAKSVDVSRSLDLSKKVNEMPIDLDTKKAGLGRAQTAERQAEQSFYQDQKMDPEQLNKIQLENELLRKRLAEYEDVDDIDLPDGPPDGGTPPEDFGNRPLPKGPAPSGPGDYLRQQGFDDELINKILAKAEEAKAPADAAKALPPASNANIGEAPAIEQTGPGSDAAAALRQEQLDRLAAAQQPVAPPAPETPVNPPVVAREKLKGGRRGKREKLSKAVLDTSDPDARINFLNEVDKPEGLQHPAFAAPDNSFERQAAFDKIFGEFVKSADTETLTSFGKPGVKAELFGKEIPEPYKKAMRDEVLRRISQGGDTPRGSLP